jgi:hypothetical protein
MTHDTKLREMIAEMVYGAFPFDGKHPSGRKPAWVPGGNAIMQDKARAVADAILSIPALRGEEIRARALEEAAQICDAWRRLYAEMLSEDCAQGALTCALSLRSLTAAPAPVGV